jgi:hypothetical protein
MALTVEEIVMSGLCIGCGLCQAIADRERVTLVLTDASGSHLQSSGGPLPSLIRIQTRGSLTYDHTDSSRASSRNPAMMDVSKRELNEFAGLLERTRRALELSTANQFCSTTGAVAELLQQ